MATADTNTPQPLLPALASNARTIVAGLGWGAVMLAVFGFWMRSKYEGTRPILTYIFLAGAAAAAGLAFWQAFTLWFQKQPDDQKTVTLEKQRNLFGYIFIAAGFGLIVLAFVLGIDKAVGSGSYSFRRENFAETFGALLFGLISLFGGYALQQPLSGAISPIQLLIDKIPVMKVTLFVIAAGSLLCIGYLMYAKPGVSGTPVDKDGKKIEMMEAKDKDAKLAEPTRTQVFLAYFPEFVSLFFLSVLCVACVGWLNSGQFDEFGIRLFVLVFGGTAGIILFIETLGRAIIWRQDIFLGGTAAWQGENSYRFWLCAYLMFVSLVIMFFSFNLARADIRKHVVLRRVMYGYDTIVQAFLLIGILAILNIVVYALVPFSFDWTSSRGAYALAESSKNLISGLKQEANIIVLAPQGHPVTKDVHNLLDNCEAISNRLKVKYVPPDTQQVEFEVLARSFPSIETAGGRGVLIVYGPMPTSKDHNTPHTFVQFTKLFDVDRPKNPNDKPKFSFKGEMEILRELRFLVDAKKKRKVYFVQGNGEPSIATGGEQEFVRREFNSPFTSIGITFLTERLGTDNYDVFGLSFGAEVPGQKPPPPPNLVYAKEGADKKKQVPDDCDTLVLAGTSKELKQEVLDALERYMDQKNGRMLVYLDVVTEDNFSGVKNTGIEGFLRKYGVEVTNEFIMREPDRQIQDPRAMVATAPTKTEHALAGKFVRKAVLMKRSARVVKASELPGRYKAETILQLNSGAEGPVIVEKDMSVLKDWRGYMLGLLQDERKLRVKFATEPVSVAVAVTDTDSKKPRMVVFGDTEFITDIEINQSPTRATNYDITAGAIDWTAERESFVGPQPKDHKVFTLDIGVDFWRMVLLPGWIMLVAITALGIAIWVIRRR